MDRRTFVKAGLTLPFTQISGCSQDDNLGAIGVEACSNPKGCGEWQKDKKNLVFIIADDLNCDVNGFMSHPHAVTPNLDRLRSRGVSFTNAHANSPLCAPSRPSFLSGHLASSTGHYHGSPKNFRDRPAYQEAVLLPQHLSSENYQTYLTGKVAHSSTSSLFTDNAQDHFVGRLGYGTSYGPYPWNGNPNLWPKNSENHEFPEPIQAKKFGFGRLSAPPRWENGERKWFYGDRNYIGEDGRQGGEFVYESSNSRSLLPDELSVEWATNLISGGAAVKPSSDGSESVIATPILREKPFALFLGLTKPHKPNYVPDVYFDRILVENGLDSSSDIELPKLPPGDRLDPSHDQPGDDTTPEDVDDIPKWRLRSPNATGRDSYRSMIAAGSDWPGGTDQLFKDTLHAYLASVLFIDDQVGKILDSIEAEGIEDNTVVVFLSDHGFSHGEKEAFFKYNLWNESTKVPLIIADPSEASKALHGSSTDQPVSLIDVYPTIQDILDLPEIPTPGFTPAVDGISLSPILNGRDLTASNSKPVALCMIKTYVMNRH